MDNAESLVDSIMPDAESFNDESLCENTTSVQCTTLSVVAQPARTLRSTPSPVKKPSAEVDNARETITEEPITEQIDWDIAVLTVFVFQCSFSASSTRAYIDSVCVGTTDLHTH
jgi:hypothetical protein